MKTSIKKVKAVLAKAKRETVDEKQPYFSTVYLLEKCLGMTRGEAEWFVNKNTR